MNNFFICLSNSHGKCTAILVAPHEAGMGEVSEQREVEGAYGGVSSSTRTSAVLFWGEVGSFRSFPGSGSRENGGGEGGMDLLGDVSTYSLFMRFWH